MFEARRLGKQGYSAGPQTFTFQLVASDVAGYSAANVTFELSIGPHILGKQGYSQQILGLPDRR
jgi:hypothetical protein